MQCQADANSKRNNNDEFTALSASHHCSFHRVEFTTLDLYVSLLNAHPHPSALEFQFIFLSRVEVQLYTKFYFHFVYVNKHKQLHENQNVHATTIKNKAQTVLSTVGIKHLPSSPNLLCLVCVCVFFFISDSLNRHSSWTSWERSKKICFKYIHHDLDSYLKQQHQLK